MASVMESEKNNFLSQDYGQQFHSDERLKDSSDMLAISKSHSRKRNKARLVKSKHGSSCEPITDRGTSQLRVSASHALAQQIKSSKLLDKSGQSMVKLRNRSNADINN